MAKPVTLRYSVAPFSFGWDLGLEVNSPAPGWRGWLGVRLRRLAQRVDGCRSLGVRLRTQPPIGPEAEDAVINAALDAMHRGLRDLVREAAVDQALRELYPELLDQRATTP